MYEVYKSRFLFVEFSFMLYDYEVLENHLVVVYKEIHAYKHNERYENLKKS